MKRSHGVLAMAALDFAVMARGIRTNELMPNAQLGSCLLKQCWQITFAAGEVIGKLGAVVRLDAFYPDAAASYHAVSLRRKSAEE